MKLKKEFIIAKILVHPYQARIVRGLESGKIDLEVDSLRDIGKKISIDKKSTSQIVKHHLEQLVTYGILQKIYGEYVYYKNNLK